MSEHSTTTQVLFGDSFVKPLLARFDQPRSSSDAGAVLVRALDDRLDITEALAGAVQACPCNTSRTSVLRPPLELTLL